MTPSPRVCLTGNAEVAGSSPALAEAVCARAFNFGYNGIDSVLRRMRAAAEWSPASD